MLRDPSEENVIPVVQELQRRLCPASSALRVQSDGKELGGHDVEATEEDGELLAQQIFNFMWSLTYAFMITYNNIFGYCVLVFIAMSFLIEPKIYISFI